MTKLLRLATCILKNYYLLIPRYQHGQEPHRTSQAPKKISVDIFLSYHPAGERRSTQTVYYKVNGYSVPWECPICLCTRQGVSSGSNFHRRYANFREHDIAIFYSLGKKGVGCHSVWCSWVTTKGHRKPSSAGCTLGLPAGVTGLLSAGGGSLDSDIHLHLFTGCVQISFRCF